MTSVDYTVPANGSAPPLPDQLSPVGRRSDLDDLEAELTAALDEETITEPVPERKGFSVTYRTHIAREQMSAWAQAAAVDGGINEERYYQLVLAGTCKCINKPDGTPMRDSTGTEVTFASAELQAKYGTDKDALATVAAFYKYTPDVYLAGMAVTRASRWSEVVAEANPTNG